MYICPFFFLPDIIDIVKDPISSGDYRKEEDPKIFCSEATGRGPLDESWREAYTGPSWRPGPSVMTAYKLCRVEFKYWGMQNKIERFIHDTGKFCICLPYKDVAPDDVLDSEAVWNTFVALQSSSGVLKFSIGPGGKKKGQIYTMYIE